MNPWTVALAAVGYVVLLRGVGRLCGLGDRSREYGRIEEERAGTPNG